MRERSIRSPRVRAIDSTAALDRGEHAEPEQVDLQEAGVGAGVLVPLHELAALHRCRQHRGSSRSAAGWRRSSRPGAGRGGAAAPCASCTSRASQTQRPPCARVPRRLRGRARPRARSFDGRRRRPPRRGRPARSRLAAAPAPCRARGSRRARGRSGRPRRAPRGRARSARGRGGSGPRGRRAGKSRSMSGSEVSSGLRKRPIASPPAIGSMCERPVR